MHSETDADAEYLASVLALHRAANPSGKLVLLAFDYAVREDGGEDRRMIGNRGQWN